MPITLEQAIEISKEKNFYRKQEIRDGVKIDIFNYHSNEYDTFTTENHLEMRGLTFVDGVIYPAMRKFFNVGETQDNSFNTLLNIGVKRMYEKLDGSFIHFVDIAGNITAKTKMSFDNPQSEKAQELLVQNPELKYFILDMWNQGWYPMFELIGPSNKVVLDYKSDELVLISVRDLDGNFIPLSGFSPNIKIAKEYNYTLEEAAKICLKDTMEGFVIHFKDGTKAKLKTEWYKEHHRLINDVSNDKSFLHLVLDGNSDDVISSMEETLKRKRQIDSKLINQYLIDSIADIENIKREINGTMSRKEIAAKYKNYDFFGILMKSLARELNLKDELVSTLKTRYNKKIKAQNFISELRNKSKM